MVQFLQYSQRTGISLFKLRFLFDGQRINPWNNPKFFNMEQDDEIDVVEIMIGGNRNDL